MWAGCGFAVAARAGKSINGTQFRLAGQGRSRLKSTWQMAWISRETLFHRQRNADCRAKPAEITPLTLANCPG
jgi:hypothetical protein